MRSEMLSRPAARDSGVLARIERRSIVRKRPVTERKRSQNTKEPLRANSDAADYPSARHRHCLPAHSMDGQNHYQARWMRSRLLPTQVRQTKEAKQNVPRKFS